MIKGKHLIDGTWVDGPSTFQSTPVQGTSHIIHNASSNLVGEAAQAAHNAYQNYAFTSSSSRAQLLRSIASEINKRGQEISTICEQETGLPQARLIGERGRTTNQLEQFATYIEKGDYLQRSVDQALPERDPIPRPELRKMMRPFGPVAIFGASNFPLAFSTAGGDTAAALAAGCPVIVKGHPAHPATSDLISQAILSAIIKCDMDPGIFSLVQDSGVKVAQALVTHPHITAVGFTGSLQGGKTLFDLCNQRPVPIPFYGEMGSLNPVFVLPESLDKSAAKIAKGWVESLNLGVGQFCTKPGLLILPEGNKGDEFISTVQQQLEDVSANLMLTSGIAESYWHDVEKIQTVPGIKAIFQSKAQAASASPNVFSTTAAQWLQSDILQEEIFGPYAIIVRTTDQEEMLAIANHLQGQLTATIFLEDTDHETALKLLQVLEQKAGRILANGYPTGVEVAESMVHGGPYPASTFMATTSVGSTAIQRFLKPVCYQNIPQSLLPQELQD